MPKGGMYGLVEGLIKLNQEKDVKINTSSKIKNHSRKSAIGVILEDGSEIFSYIIVSNVDRNNPQRLNWH